MTPQVCHNPHTARMTFPSSMVPKTTNRTAGHTPYVHLSSKRKLEYSSTKKTVRNVARKTLLSVQENNNQNKLFYSLLPDGNAAFFAARGHPDGPMGYLQPALRACSEALTNNTSRYSDLVQRLNITSILPIVDPQTGMTKKFHYAGGTRSMDIKTFLFTFDSVDDCNERTCDNICTTLVNEFNNLFNLRIAFGGNAANFGSETKQSLNEIFLTQDVINLAMIAYFDAIMDGTFFEDKELVHKYFGDIQNVRDLFSGLFSH